MGTRNRTQEVVRCLHIGHPVAQGLVDGILEYPGPRGHLYDLGAQHPHPGHVQSLPLGIYLPHVYPALQAEEGADGGRGHPMLTGTGLGNDTFLPHTLDQQTLTQGVVDLVGSGMVQVLPLQEDPDLTADAITDQLGEPGRGGQS